MPELQLSGYPQMDDLVQYLQQWDTGALYNAPTICRAPDN
jgi:hypothetical protein